MLLLWDLYWPALIAALVVGIVAGAIGFRWLGGKRRWITLGSGIGLTILATLVWHGPIGTSARFRLSVESTARTTLDYYEMTAVQAQLNTDPMTRTLVLSGPADEFQRSELVRIMDEIPGVGTVRWADASPAGWALSLLAESMLASLIAFGLGFLLSYLVELRRRARAEWSW